PRRDRDEPPVSRPSTSCPPGRRRRGLAAARVDRSDEHLLARRSLIAVRPLTRDRHRREVLRGNACPERHMPAVVERPDRNEHPRGVAEPGLVEAAILEPRKPGGRQLDSPTGRSLRQSRLAARGGKQPRRAESALEALRRASGPDEGDPDGDDQDRGYGG